MIVCGFILGITKGISSELLKTVKCDFTSTFMGEILKINGMKYVL